MDHAEEPTMAEEIVKHNANHAPNAPNEQLV